jgi:hypothetical protein
MFKNHLKPKDQANRKRIFKVDPVQKMRFKKILSQLPQSTQYKLKMGGFIDQTIPLQPYGTQIISPE